jgi:hypothetical protein
MCEPAYLAWCQQHGITTHGVRPAFVTQGWRGVVSTQRLAAGDVIMRVPQALLLSVVAARRDPQLAAQLVQHQQLSSHQVRVDGCCTARVLLARLVQQFEASTLAAWSGVNACSVKRPCGAHTLLCCNPRQ